MSRKFNVTSKYDISSSPAPREIEGSLGSGAGEQKISYLLATRVEFGSVKQHTAANITADRRAVLFRSEIDGGGAEISPRCHFSAAREPPSRPTCLYPSSLVKVVLFSEIEVNPSDVKHVMKPVGYSNGLGMAIAAQTRRWDVI